MSFDPYDVLGVEREADQDAVRAAYRSKAKAAHPDMGGSDEAFARLARAHLILSDPVRRAKYDETGQFDDAPQNIDGAAYNLINGMLQQAIAGQNDPVKFDLVDSMRGMIGQDLHALEGTRRQMTAARDRAVRLVGRFSGKRSAQFDRMLNWHREQIETQIAKADESIAQRRRAIELLEGCEFDWEKPVQQFYANAGFFGGASTSTAF